MNALFLGLALIAGAPALKGPSRNDPLPIEGLWQLAEWYIAGRTADFTPGTRTEFRPKGVRILQEGHGTAPDERGYKLYPNSTPAAIDYIRPNDAGPPDIFLGIYKVEGDTLTVALGDMGKDRAKYFEKDKEGTWFLMKFTRVKKQD